MNETWVDIPGYNGLYQASDDGNIRRIYKSGKTHIMAQYLKTSCKTKKMVVKICIDGTGRHESVMKLVALTFLGKCPKGFVPHHINGLISDNSVTNIEYITQSNLSKLTGGIGARRPVVKIDLSGTEISFYSSAREAARKNRLCPQSVIDRCNGVTKSIAPDGFDYAWDDDKISLQRAHIRIKEAKK